MTAAEPVIAALIADPDDPQQRLVYADWLEQRGALAHAQLVRLGVERAALGSARAMFGANRGLRQLTRADQKRAATLDVQLRKLGKKAHAQLETALPRLAGIKWSSSLQFGGVPEGVSVDSWETFAAHADTLAAHAPIRSLALLERLDIRGARALVSSGWLRRLRHLELHGASVTLKALEVILASDEACNLVSIDLALSRIGDAGARLLAASPYLTRLESLCLYGALVGDRGGVAIARSPHLQHLRALNLEMNHLGNATGRAFLADDLFPQMVHLNLADNEPLEEELVEPLRARWGERIEI